MFLSGKHLVAYLVGRFEGLGVDVGGPWLRTNNATRTQEIQRSLRLVQYPFDAGLGSLNHGLQDLLQGGGIVFPGAQKWNSACDRRLEFLGPYSTPFALGMAWDGVAHLLVGEVGARNHRDELVAWWGGFPGRKRQLHGLIDLRNGSDRGYRALETVRQTLGAEWYLGFGLRGTDLDVMRVEPGQKMDFSSRGIPRDMAHRDGFLLRKFWNSGAILGHPKSTKNEGNLQCAETAQRGQESAQKMHHTTMDESPPLDPGTLCAQKQRIGDSRLADEMDRDELSDRESYVAQ